MPFLGGAYGGYIGMTGNWAYWLGCSGQEHFIAYSSTNAAQAHTNFVTYHKGVGRGAYWFMGGPGVDPHYNGTQAEAASWGAQQAARALADIASGGGIDYPVVWMDIEPPGIGPGAAGSPTASAASTATSTRSTAPANPSRSAGELSRRAQPASSASDKGLEQDVRMLALDLGEPPLVTEQGKQRSVVAAGQHL